jgi:4-amino-4-deoxy-L-arabinose transferase-like glycosyltransferase
MSKASLVGKAGMSLFYSEYNFLKTWWKGGMLVLITLSFLYYLHGFIQQKTGLKQARKLHRIACFLAITGLYLTYNDFRHTLSHRLLGERFHLGVYLFWIGWMAISLYFAINPARNEPAGDGMASQQ